MAAHALVGQELTSIATALMPRLRRIVGDRLEFSVICNHDPCYVAATEVVLERLMLGLVSAARTRQLPGGWIVLQIASVPHSARSDGPPVTDLAVLTLTASAPWTDGRTTYEPNGRPLVGLAAFVDDIRAMAGHCTVETEPDGAETVCVFLPLVDSGARATRPCVLLRIRNAGFRVRVATLLRGAGFEVQPMPSERPPQQTDIILWDSSDGLLTLEPSLSLDTQGEGPVPMTPTVVPSSGGGPRVGSPRFLLHTPSQDQQPRMLDAVEFIAQVKHFARHASHKSERTRRRRT